MVSFIRVFCFLLCICLVSSQAQTTSPPASGVGSVPTPEPTFQYVVPPAAIPPTPQFSNNAAPPVLPTQTTRPFFLPPQSTWLPLNLTAAYRWSTHCVEVSRELDPLSILQKQSAFVFTGNTFYETANYSIRPEFDAVCDNVDFYFEAYGVWSLSSGAPGSVQRLTLKYAAAAVTINTDEGLGYLNIQCNSKFTTSSPSFTFTYPPSPSPPSTQAPTPSSSPTPATTSSNTTRTKRQTTEDSLPIFVQISNLDCQRFPGSSTCSRIEQIIQGNPLGDGFLLGVRPNPGRTCALVPTQFDKTAWTGAFPKPTIVPLSKINATPLSFSVSFLLMIGSLVIIVFLM